MNGCKNYQTKQKNIIHSMLVEFRNTHLTVEEIINILINRNTPVAKATVYRCLDSLMELGIVKKWNLSNKTSYQYIGEEDNQMMLKCEDCGKVICIDKPVINKKVDNEVYNKYGFLIDISKTVLYCKCIDCKEKEV